MGNGASPGVIENERRIATWAAHQMAISTYEGLASWFNGMGNTERAEYYRKRLERLHEIGRKEREEREEQRRLNAAQFPPPGSR